MAFVFLVIGFVMLIKGADWLVEGSASIAKKFKIPDIVIGLTIVAMGTSMPELSVNLFASFQGNSEIAIGNVLGSNIANILLILGITAILYPVAVKRNTIHKEIPFSLLAIVAVAFMANDVLIDKMNYNALTRSDGLALIGFFVIFIYYIVGLTKDGKNELTEDFKNISFAKGIIFVLIGLVGLVVGGKWIVDNAVLIAGTLGLSETLIGLTIVAVGTSLPELATSIVAALKKNTDIAIGNVVGSNIFNIYWILGISSVIRPLPFEPTSNTDIFMVIVATLLLFSQMYIGKKHHLERSGGVIFVLIYFVYVGYLVIRG